jgi:hypothetical protein
MSGFLAFCDEYKDEETCITALADLRWPGGFVCEKCNGIKAYHLSARPRIFECAACGHQHSVTAGTVFHKTRTDLRKWFLAAYLIGHDKRGVSAMFISRELGLRYDTAWLMCHKLRHALTENTSFKLEDFVEIDEAFYGGRRQKGNRGRAQTSGKVLIVCAVEKRSVAGTNNKGINQQGYVGGDARIAVIPNATAGVLGGFIQSAIKPGTWIVSDGFKGYSKSKLTAYRHIPITQGAGANAASVLPIVHKVFSNIKAWLNGTYHGVSAKHLPRYLREWSYRFNRRGFIPDLDRYLLRRAAGRATITYGQLVAGRLAEGAP